MAEEKIGVVGLGYVGLPLAVTFATKFDVVGFDISEDRVRALNGGHDDTGEVDDDLLKKDRLTLTSDAEALKSCSFIIVAVPTPLTKAKEPDLGALSRPRPSSAASCNRA